ncbi:substrate-binding domain-containing protein [Pseudomonas abietaniphila]|uniref:substrate-binding domain-containing protein n=1 Tax=Pseudomonas abietaniphila TaxID=89065 RepID=UPI0007844C17|nr:substrate-binding domain-containing protein [Pseudomonas abietaniphila]
MHPRFRPLLLTCIVLSTGLSHAADKPADRPVTLRLLCSSGFIAAARTLAPDYEKSRSIHLDIIRSPTADVTLTDTFQPESSPQAFDLVLTDRAAMDRLVAQRRVDPATRVDLGQSFIAMAVKDGAKQPRIDTVAALRDALMNAESVAYANTPTGMYLSHWLFPRMALDRNFELKSRALSAEPVGSAVARGDVQLGFQQLSELKAAPGIDIVGLIPDNVQQMVLYSGALMKNSPHPMQARALLDYMKSSQGRAAIKQSGLEPF